MPSLTQVTRGGWTAEEGSRTAENKLLQYYTMAYDKYGQMTKFFVGTDSGFQLVENTYNTIGQMTSQTYGNGDVVAYTYDNLGRMVESSVNGETQAQYHYSTDGKLSAIEAKGQRYQYIYDDLDRLIYSGQSDLGGTMVLETRHEYDLKNRLTAQTIRMGDTVYAESYAYDDYDRLDSMTAGNGDTITPTYDKLNRVESVETPEYTVNYTYTDGLDITHDEVSYNGTTALVSGITYTSDSGSAMFSEGYLYDSLGRISRITDGSQGNVYYVYDSMGQMTEETSITDTWEYTYDTFGNILTASHDGTAHTYTYGNATWRDLLTAYDGETILYEGQTTVTDTPTSGNPISYYNGTRWAFDWDNGRQLVSADSADASLDFTYDHNGIRTSKTVNTVDYVLVEHTWTQTVTAPTCTEAGYTLNECSCGNVYQSDPVSALGHDYTEAITEDQEVFTCTRCGHSYSQDHDHAYTQSHVVPPTCAINGYTVYTCVCGDTTTGDSVPALGHNYQETSRDTYWIYYACTRCGATAQEPIVAPPVEVSLLSEESGLVEGCIEYEPVDVQTVHEYIYASGKLLRETITTSVEGTLTDTTVLDFYYDQNGRPYSFTCDGEEYFYILNLQGDVVAICDESCNVLGSYLYNAWGEITIQSGTIAEINPIRYRGYYYDSELEMYYLQSRYYDPSICRFINADGYASTGQGFIGYNMFAYCNDCPIMFVDVTGSILGVPTLSDYYQIHKEVQYDIAEKTGYAIEVYVNGEKGRGYLDIYDAENNEYYEVKSVFQVGLKHTTDQMKKYDVAHVKDWRFLGYQIDESPNRGMDDISGSFKYSEWIVNYHSLGNGLISYTLLPNKEVVAAEVMVAGGAVAASVANNVTSMSGLPARAMAGSLWTNQFLRFY